MKEINGKLYGYSSELNNNTPAEDLLEFNAVDSGEKYVSYNGAWFRQPVAWAAPAASGGGGGSGSSGLVVTVDDDTGTLDHTWQEIFDAAPFVVIDPEEGETQKSAFPLFVVYNEGDTAYACAFADGSGESLEVVTFVTDSPDGYPVESSI